MSLVYIDTNIFLGFYQSSEDRLAVFKEVQERSRDVILTEQTIEEFHRNRVARLLALAEAVEASAKYQIHTTAVVRDLPGYAKWRDARDDSKAAAIEIADEIRSWANNEPGDLVLSEFNSLTETAKIVRTSALAIERARVRKLLGKPPTSPDKHTIGDELIWESILEGSNDNIVIVSRDKTFLKNQAVLKSEFRKTTSRDLVLITRSLSNGLAAVGKASETIKAAEESFPQEPIEVIRETDRLRFVKGPYGIGAGPVGQHVDSSFFCPTCGSNAWNGNRCVVCGRMDDD